MLWLKAKCVILSLMLSVLMVSSCSNDPSIEFSLSRYKLDLLSGEVAEISVSGELEFAVKCSNENVVTARRDGRKAVLTAVGEGTAEVLFLSQFSDLVCNVTVKDSLMSNIEDKLADTTSRISGSGMSLVYGVPGIMITKNGEKVEFIDINSGESVALSWVDGNLAEVKVNGVKQQVADIALYKETADKLWYLVTLQGNIEGFWAVVDKNI